MTSLKSPPPHPGYATDWSCQSNDDNVKCLCFRAHKDSETREFVLMTIFPNKELTDENRTVEESGLKNAVVVQKLNKEG